MTYNDNIDCLPGPDGALLTIFATLESRDNGPAFKGEPSIKVNIFWSQLNLFNVISPLFKGEPEIKVRILESQWNR